MGTSIHAFIECDHTPDNDSPFRPAGDGMLEVYAFTTGELLIPRDYDLFDALALGRSAQIAGGREDKKLPLFAARGLPASLSYAVKQRYYHRVADPDYYEKGRFDPVDAWLGSLPPVSREQALEWIAQGLAQWGPVEQQRDNVAWDLLSNPAWHTASWLTLTEIYRALEHFGLDVRITSAEFMAALAAMTGLDKHYGAGRTRLIFWFDS